MEKDMMVMIIYAAIVLNPGCTMSQIAKKLGLCRSTVESKVIKMEGARLRVCEDNKYCLYPHSRNGRPSSWLMSMSV